MCLCSSAEALQPKQKCYPHGGGGSFALSFPNLFFPPSTHNVWLIFLICLLVLLSGWFLDNHNFNAGSGEWSARAGSGDSSNVKALACWHHCKVSGPDAASSLAKQPYFCLLSLSCIIPQTPGILPISANACKTTYERCRATIWPCRLWKISSVHG